MENSKIRNWCFTLNNKLLPQDYPFNKEDVKYCIWQHEKGTTEHTQGYIELTKPVRFAYIKKWKDFEGGHFEKRKGTREQARDYCRKEDSRINGPFEYGDFGIKQGTRSDLEDAVNLLKEHREISRVAEEYTSTFVKYHRGFKEYLCVTEPKGRVKDSTHEVALHFGSPGTGKSASARTFFANSKLFVKGPSTRNWWDGYDGEDAVIIDEFKGNLPRGELLQVIDVYDCRVEVKGGTRELKANKFIITTNYLPNKWYEDLSMLEAITRRFTKFRLFVKSEIKSTGIATYYEYTDYELFKRSCELYELGEHFEGEKKTIKCFEVKGGGGGGDEASGLIDIPDNFWIEETESFLRELNGEGGGELNDEGGEGEKELQRKGKRKFVIDD